MIGPSSMDFVDIEATLARLDLESQQDHNKHCPMCREMDERKARNTCKVLSHGQWCAQGWHWEYMNGPGYTFENAIVMCPNEIARLKEIRRLEKMTAQLEVAQKVASETEEKREVAKLTEGLLDGTLKFQKDPE